MENNNIKKNFIWNTTGSFVYLFCQWLLTLLVVRMSSTLNNAGNLALAIAITNAFFNLACFNLRPYLVSDNKKEYTVDDYTTFRTITIVVSLILCIIYISMFKYSPDQFLCIVLFMLFKIGEAIVDLFHAFEQRKNRMDIGGISLLCRGILSLFSFYLGLKLTNNINMAIILMIVTTYTFILLFDFPKVNLFEKVKIKLNKKHIKNLFMVLLPLAIGSVLSTISTAFPRQMLEKIHGTSILGIYATIATPAVIVQVAASYIYNPLLTSFADFRKKNDYKNTISLLKKVLLIILALSLVCYIGALIFAKPVLALLFGNKIAKHSYLFGPIIIYTSLTGFLWLFHNILIVFRKIKALMLIEISGFVLCLITAKFFITKFYMNGISYNLIFITIVMIIEMLITTYIEISKMKKEKV